MSAVHLRLAALALLAACAPRDPTDPRVRSAPSPSAFPLGRALPPGITHVDRVEHYEITGDDALELRHQIRERAPMIRGRIVTGRTDYSIRWTYRTERRAGWCRPSDVRVAATITIIMPAFTPADSTSDLARDWSAFRARLERHERGHREIALAGLPAVQQAIRAVQTSHCAELRQEVDRRARAALARIRERNDAYDREEGRDPQRPVWPPRPTTPAPSPVPPPR